MKIVRDVVLWGIAIYAVMFLLWSGLVMYGVSGELYALIARLALLLSVTYLAGASIRVASWKDLLPLTLGWALIAILLDGIFLVPYTGWSLYASWSVWVGYSLIAALPFLSRFAGIRHHLPAARAL